MVLNGITLDRLADRRTLLAALDGFRREVDTSGQVAGADAYTQQAFGILTSSRLMQALDFKNEDPAVVARYGQGDPRNRDDGAPKLMEQFLVARRLVEAGARCVTLAFSRWDHHGDNFERCARIFRCSTRASVRSSPISRSAGWTAMCPCWSPGSLAGRLPLIRMAVAITGLGSVLRCWLEAVFGMGR